MPSPAIKIPSLRTEHPALNQEQYSWIKSGASAIWTDNQGTEHHVLVSWVTTFQPDTDSVDDPPQVAIRYQSRIDLRDLGSDAVWYVPAASLKKDVLAELLTLTGETDSAGFLQVKLSQQDLNGLDAIVRLARSERTAGALDRIVVIAESILQRYRKIKEENNG